MTLEDKGSAPDPTAVRRASITLISPDGSTWDAISAQEEREGIQVQRFRKELFRAGHYEQGDGTSFDVTTEDLAVMAGETTRMIENGVRIPLSAGPVPHEDVSNPHNSIGTLEFVTVEGSSIFGVLEIVGEDEITEARQNDVSIFSPPEFADGKGETYRQPITHVAVTPNPLVPGLGDWIQIAASLKVEGKEGHSFKGGLTMWKKIAKALGLSAEDTEKITDENGIDTILSAIKDMKAAHKKEVDDLKATHKEEISNAKKAHKEVKASLDALTGEKEIDETMVSLVEDNRKMKLDALVSASRITPEIRERIEKRYGVKEAIAASMKAGRNGEDFDFMVEVMKDNDPIKLTEQTGAQVITASLEKPREKSDVSDVLIEDARKRAESAKK